MKLSCLHFRVSAVRKGALHKLSSHLTQKFNTIGIEDLNVRGMLQNGKLCSACGFKLDVLALSVRKWSCPNCNSEHGRDLNAAINLEKYAVSSTVSDRREESSGCQHKLVVELASMKQEVNAKTTYL